MRGPRCRKDRAQHLFRARLADASRHGDDACPGPFARLLRQRIQGLQRIGDAEKRAVRSRFKSLFHHGGGGALFDRSADEPVPVHALALDRKEQITAFQSAAVDGDAVHRNGRGTR